MNENRILYKECIRIYEVEESFIESLCESGLISLTNSDDDKFVEYDDLEHLEQYVRWYNDMNINVEGIEALHHMLERVKALQSEISLLQNELRFYRNF